MFAVLGCCYCLCTMGGESATPGRTICRLFPLYNMDHTCISIYFLHFHLASTNGYSVITSPAPSAALSPYDQKMYEAMSTDVKKKSMKKVFFTTFF